MTRAAIYARVSTREQNPEMQLAELRAYCARRAWSVAGEYVDQASGADTERPQLLALLERARRHTFDAVLVYRYDRFARNLRSLVNALSEFHDLGVQFVSVHEGVDTSTANGRLIFGIFASLAEFERELIRDRVRSGIAAARDRGVVLGRPPGEPFDQARVDALRAARRSWRQIADELGRPSSTLRRRRR